MTLNQGLGFVLGAVGVWMMWQCGIGFAQFLEAGEGPGSVQELLFDKDYALRLLTSLAAFVGGLAALNKNEGRTWMTGICSFIFGVVTFALIANRADVSAWRTEAVLLVMITGLTLCLIVAQNQRENSPARSEGDLAQG